MALNLTGLVYTDSGLNAGTTYYYVITATNSFGESGPSTEASAHPVVTTPPQIILSNSNGQMQLGWPMDHLGWRLEVQTNDLVSGLGTNWVAIPTSAVTNQVLIPVGPGAGAVFYRLVYP